jgi:hypothetical protein
VATVSSFLVAGILSASGPAPCIEWLTRRKALFRMLAAPFRRRDLFIPQSGKM